MKHLKKYTIRLLAVTLAAVMSLFAVGGSAFANGITYKWGVDRSSSNVDDRYGWNVNGSTKFSVDDKIYTPTSTYSIKLDNTDYNLSYVERTYNVEPYTTYKFSAMVKYSGYELSPEAKPQKSGACVGKAYTYENSGFTTSPDWTFMEYEFTTKNETTYNLALQNGIFNGDCKGTAWFCDVKLEKAEMTNSWNILAVFFKNMDATVTLNGETVHHKMSLTEANIEEMNKFVLDTTPNNFRTMTNNKMTINSIDRFYTDETLTEKDLKVRAAGGYYLDPKKSETLSKTLDKYLAKKHYNVIIVFVPFKGITGGWLGNTSTYKEMNFITITNARDGFFEKDEFQGAVIVHEITHCLERKSRKINDDKTPDLDTERKTYQDKYGLSAMEWYTSYLNATLPDGRGLDPSVFNVTSGKYSLVSDDMTTGVGIEPGSSSIGGNVVPGDVDNNGKFNLSDITAALKLFINGSSVNQRTLEAIGAAAKWRIELGDITRLLKEYVNS